MNEQHIVEDLTRLRDELKLRAFSKDFHAVLNYDLAEVVYKINSCLGKGYPRRSADQVAEPPKLVWECKAGGLKKLTQEQYDKQTDNIKIHYTQIEEPTREQLLHMAKEVRSLAWISFADHRTVEETKVALHAILVATVSLGNE